MMESSFTILRVRGIPIGAHWSWLFVFVLVLWSLATVLFPATYPGLDGAIYLAMAAAAAVLFFASVLAHELGHALRAVGEGERIDGITLWLFGGVARLRGHPESPGAEFRIAAAGPAVTVVLVVVFWLVALGAGRLDWPDGVRGVFDYLARINLLVLGFNLVPALPLDGGRVLRAWLWRRQRSFLAATRSAARAGQAFGMLLVAIGLLGLFTGGGLGGIWFVFLGWFLIKAAQSEAVLALARQALGERRVRDPMSPEPVAVAPDRTVAQFVEEAAGNRRFSSYPVVDQGRLVGVVSLAAAKAVPPLERERRRVAEIMTGREHVPTVEGDRAAADVLAQLGGQGKRAMVVDDGRLVGVVSGTDVIELLQASPAGTLVRLTVERDGGRETIGLETRQLPALSGGAGIGVQVETRDLQVDLPFQVRFRERAEVAGPSAGLAYALVVADLLDQGDYARGRTVAATGTIQVDGDVGLVGGVEQKALAAERDRADLFLVPSAEVEAARGADLRVQGVGRLEQVLDLLSTAA